MITTADLQKMARERLKDAEILYAQARYDMAYYLCGYAVELKIKTRMVKTLNWPGLPEPGDKPPHKIVVDNKVFMTHDLGRLLNLSGRLSKINRNHFTDWSIVAQWDPSECRYQPVGARTQAEVRDMIQATRVIMAALR
jgi:hypothetical protein